MVLYLAVAFGGALGALLRFVLVTATGLPVAILLANVAGSSLMGALVGGQQNGFFSFSPFWQSFLLVGVLGAFTTFSTFSYEAFMFFQQGQVKMAVSYVLASVLLALVGFALGYKIISFF